MEIAETSVATFLNALGKQGSLEKGVTARRASGAPQIDAPASHRKARTSGKFADAGATGAGSDKKRKKRFAKGDGEALGQPVSKKKAGKAAAGKAAAKAAAGKGGKRTAHPSDPPKR